MLMLFSFEFVAIFGLLLFTVMVIISEFMASFKKTATYEDYCMDSKVIRVRSQFQENRRAYLARLSRELHEEVKIWEEKSFSYAEPEERLRPQPIPQAQTQLQPQHIEINLETSVPEAKLIPVPEPTNAVTAEAPEPIPQPQPQTQPQTQPQMQTPPVPPVSPQLNSEVYQSEVIQLSEHRNKIYPNMDSPFARIMASRTSKAIATRTQAFASTIAQTIQPSKISEILASRAPETKQRRSTSTIAQTAIYQTASPPRRTTATSYGPQYHYGLDVSPVHGIRNLGRSSTRVVPVTPIFYEDDYPPNPEELYQTFLENAKSGDGEDNHELENAIRDYKANNKAYDELQKRLASAM